jgi:hypothetical protein
MCFAFAPQQKSHAILAHRGRTPKSVAHKFRVRCCILKPDFVQPSPYALLMARVISGTDNQIILGRGFPQRTQHRAKRGRGSKISGTKPYQATPFSKATQTKIDFIFNVQLGCNKTFQSLLWAPQLAIAAVRFQTVTSEP